MPLGIRVCRCDDGKKNSVAKLSDYYWVFSSENVFAQIKFWVRSFFCVGWTDWKDGVRLSREPSRSPQRSSEMSPCQALDTSDTSCDDTDKSEAAKSLVKKMKFKKRACANKLGRFFVFMPTDVSTKTTPSYVGYAEKVFRCWPMTPIKAFDTSRGVSTFSLSAWPVIAPQNPYVACCETSRQSINRIGIWVPEWEHSKGSSNCSRTRNFLFPKIGMWMELASSTQKRPYSQSCFVLLGKDAAVGRKLPTSGEAVVPVCSHCRASEQWSCLDSWRCCGNFLQTSGIVPFNFQFFVLVLFVLNHLEWNATTAPVTCDKMARTHQFYNFDFEDRSLAVWAFVPAWDWDRFRRIAVVALHRLPSDAIRALSVLRSVMAARGDSVFVVATSGGSNVLVANYASFLESGYQQKLLDYLISDPTLLRRCLQKFCHPSLLFRIPSPGRTLLSPSWKVWSIATGWCHVLVLAVFSQRVGCQCHRWLKFLQSLRKCDHWLCYTWKILITRSWLASHSYCFVSCLIRFVFWRLLLCRPDAEDDSPFIPQDPRKT